MSLKEYFKYIKKNINEPIDAIKSNSKKFLVEIAKKFAKLLLRHI